MTSAQTDPNNRRASARVPLGLPARLWVESGWQSVRCEEVSLEGAGLVHAKRELRDLLTFPTQRRCPLRVSLTLPDGVLELRARLVHRGTNRMGIRFVEVLPDDRARLRRCCAED